MSEVAVLEQRGSSLGLDIADDLPFEDWVGMGRKLRQAVDRAGWWIGDWVNYGEVTYGRKYELALDVTGLSYSTLRNYASVCRKIELSRRRDNLSFGHHDLLAPLDRADQERWLDLAEREGLSVRDLQQRLQIGRGASTTNAVLQRVTIGSLEPERAQRWREAAERAEKPFVEWAAEALDQAAA